MSFLAAKNLIFLQDTKNNFNFLVDSGAHFTAFQHSTTHRSTPGGSQRQDDPRLGISQPYHLFSGQNFEFDFLLAAVATPSLLGMNFLTTFGFSIIPSKQQVLHPASGRTFSKASTISFTSPWSPKTVAALPAQVQQLLEEFPSLLRPSAAPPPEPLHGVVHHIDTCSTAPMFARPRRLDLGKHRIAEEEFLAMKKQVLFTAPTRLGCHRCT
jgi:hypothetical protein